MASFVASGCVEDSSLCLSQYSLSGSAPRSRKVILILGTEHLRMLGKHRTAGRSKQRPKQTPDKMGLSCPL